MPVSEICRTMPFPPIASRNTGRWLTLLAAVEPMAMMVPPGATVAPDTLSLAAAPSGAVGCQEVPVPVLVYARIRPVALAPVTTKP